MSLSKHASIGCSSIDRDTVTAFSHFVNRRELFLAQDLRRLLLNQLIDPAARPPLERDLPRSYRTTSIGLENNIKQITEELGLLPSSLEKEGWHSLQEQVERLFWHHLELLEGATQELFEQLHSLTLEQWNEKLSSAMEALYLDLKSRLEELPQICQHLENLLQKHNAPRWKGWSSLFSKRWLTPALSLHTKKCLCFLANQQQIFTAEYKAICEVNEFAEKSNKQLDFYVILQGLDDAVRGQIYRLSHAFHAWNHSTKYSDSIHKKFGGELRQLCYQSPPLSLLKSYGDSLQNTLFQWSRAFKNEGARFFDTVLDRKEMLSLLGHYRAELIALQKLTLSCAEFLSLGRPNLYARTNRRWRPPPEGEESRNLRQLAETLQKFDQLYSQAEHGVASYLRSEENSPIPLLFNEIEQLFHEIAQPLTTQLFLANRIEELLNKLIALNEVGTFQRSVVIFIDAILGRLLRADNRYHVLAENAIFHELWEVHRKILSLPADRKHEQRINQLRSLFSSLAATIQGEETAISKLQQQLLGELQNELQSFYAAVQRALLDEDKVETSLLALFRAQLSDYRYLFLQFIGENRKKQNLLLMNRLKVIDHYFESVEWQIDQAKSNSSQT